MFCGRPCAKEYGHNSVYAVSVILALLPSVKGSLTAGQCPHEKRL